MEIYKQSLKEGESLSTPKEIISIIPESKRFFERYGKYCICTKNDNRYKIRLYTDNYEYIMSFNKDKNDRVYCSGGFNCRRQGIMETWTRGNDMADGYDVEHVLDRFEREMLENELIFIGETSIRKEQESVEVELVKN